MRSADQYTDTATVVHAPRAYAKKQFILKARGVCPPKGDPEPILEGLPPTSSPDTPRTL